MEPEALARLPFFDGLPRWALAHLAERARVEELPAGRTVQHQHERTRTVHLLLAGALQTHVRVGDDDLLVAVLREPGELVGWSAFRPPHRAAASVRCEQPSRLLAVPAAAFEELLDREPALGWLLLGRVAAAVADRLEQARERLLAAPGHGAAPAGP